MRAPPAGSANQLSSGAGTGSLVIVKRALPAGSVGLAATGSLVVVKSGAPPAGFARAEATVSLVVVKSAPPAGLARWCVGNGVARGAGEEDMIILLAPILSLTKQKKRTKLADPKVLSEELSLKSCPLGQEYDADLHDAIAHLRILDGSLPEHAKLGRAVNFLRPLGQQSTG